MPASLCSSSASRPSFCFPVPPYSSAVSDALCSRWVSLFSAPKAYAAPFGIGRHLLV